MKHGGRGEVEGVRVLDGALGNREPLHPVRQGRMVAQHDCLGFARPRKDLPPVERPLILPRMGMVLQQLWVQIRSPSDDGTDAKVPDTFPSSFSPYPW